nr:hypothetical protein [Tanacetum cinerariifolium]
MDTTIDQQVAKDKALVPHAKRLRIGRSNFRQLSDIKSKESTLQLVYDVVHLTSFFKAFLVTADVLKIYMQEFWATATLHHHFIRFKMNNKKHIVNLESFREMDDHMFSTIKLVSRHHNTQQFGALLPIELTNKDIRNSNAYKECYAVATGVTLPKPKASVWKTRSTKASKAKSLSALSEEGSDDRQASDEEEFIHPSLSTYAEEEPRDEESFDPIPKTPKDTDDEGNGEKNLGLNVGREEGHDEEEEEDEQYRDVNINQGRGIQTTQEVKDSHVTLTPEWSQSLRRPRKWMYRLQSQWPFFLSAPTLTSSTIATITTTQQAPIPPTIAPSTLLQDLPNFGSLFQFNHRLKTLERMNKAVKVAIQIQSDQLRDEAQADNDEFLKTIDENMQKIIKEQVKEQVKVQVSKILPKIEQTVNEQLEAKVLTRNLYKALVKAYESDKIILDTYEDTVMLKRRRGDDADRDEEPFAGSDQGSNRRREGKEPENLYKALVEAYESDKIILDTYEDTVMLKRRRDDDADRDEEPFAGSDQGSNRRREGKEPESASAPIEKATRSVGNSTKGSRSRQKSASESTTAEEPMQTTFEMEEPSHPEFETSCRVIPFDHFINNDLEYLRGGASSRKYTTSVTKTKAADYRHIKWIEDLVPKTMWIQEPIGHDKHAHWGISRWGRKRQQFYGFAVNRESARDVRVEDLQLGVESYQKKLNLTKPDTYRSDLKRNEAYIAYSNPRGFIYKNKDKKNKLMRIDELQKFSDGTLTDVRTALDDRLKGIRMPYLPQSIWRKSDKDRAAAMI